MSNRNSVFFKNKHGMGGLHEACRLGSMGSATIFWYNAQTAFRSLWRAGMM